MFHIWKQYLCLQWYVVPVFFYRMFGSIFSVGNLVYLYFIFGSIRSVGIPGTQWFGWSVHPITCQRCHCLQMIKRLVGEKIYIFYTFWMYFFPSEIYLSQSTMYLLPSKMYLPELPTLIPYCLSAVPSNYCHVLSYKTCGCAVGKKKPFKSEHSDLASLQEMYLLIRNWGISKPYLEKTLI